MGNDELCCLSGIRPYYAGPLLLYTKSTQEERVAKTILQNLIASPYLPATLSKDDLQKMVADILSGHPESCGGFEREFPWKTYPAKDWDGFNHFIAIGDFGGANTAGQSSTVELALDGRMFYRSPTGREICVRQVRSITSWCSFEEYWDDESKEWKVGLSDISPYEGNTNIGCLKAPLAYLRAWIDWEALPPRSLGFPEDPEPMSVEAELYEVANSRVPGRRNEGGLPFIDYGGIEKTLEQYQDLFIASWDKTTLHLERAIRDGITGNGLRMALSRDFGVWMTVRTDVWPTKSKGDVLILHDTHHRHTFFHTVPTELLIEILMQLSPQDYAVLLSVSRSLRRLLQSGILDAAVRRQILSPCGSLRWILPVDAMPGEDDAFRTASETWLRNTPGTLPPASISVHDSVFPHYGFLSAAWMHDSMRNRRRLWNITKQFESLWRDYRSNGWESKKFCPQPADEEDDLEAD